MDARHCKHCGKLLERKQYGNILETSIDFARRNFCGMACREEFDLLPQPTDPSPERIRRLAAAIRRRNDRLKRLSVGPRDAPEPKEPMPFYKFWQNESIEVE